MTSALVRLEIARLLRSPWLLAMLLLFALSCGYALANGHAAHRTDEAQHATVLAEGQEADSAYRRTLARAQAGASVEEYKARPMTVTRPAVLRDHPLGDFAIGARDLFPTWVRVRLFESSADLFRNYQFENPDLLKFGRLDLVVVVVILLPFLMVAMSFDVVATDRRRGTLWLLLAQGVSLRRVIWTRLLVRNGLLWAVLPLTCFVGMALVSANTPTSEAAALIGGWLLIATFYGLFWLGVIVVVVSHVSQSDRAAAVLLGTWALIVLIVPAACSAAGDRAHPSPSRLAYHSAARGAAADGSHGGEAWLARYRGAHPGAKVAPNGVEPWYRDAYIQTMVVEERTAAFRQRFVAEREARDKLLGRLQFLSPALVAERTLYRLAGADAERLQRFQDDVVRFHAALADRLGPATVGGQRLSLSAYDALPRFGATDGRQFPVAIPWLAASYLLFAAALAVIVVRRLGNGPSSRPDYCGLLTAVNVLDRRRRHDRRI